MSFAVTAVSKKLAAAGLDHIITENGRIIVEAYDKDALVADLVSVTKSGKTWTYKRSPKKKVTQQVYYRKLMQMKRAAGYSVKEKKMAALRAGKAKDADRVKSAKKAYTTSPKLKARVKEAAKKEAAKKTAKKAVKAPAKKAGKTAAKKRMV
jgi:hypothetical protein